MVRKPIHILSMLLIAAVAATPLAGQDEGGEQFDPRKVVKQIQEDLDSIIDELAKLSGVGVGAVEGGQRVVDNIDKLFEDMQGAQGRVVGKIDELIKNLKMQQSNQKSQQQQQQQNGNQQQKNGQQKPGDRRNQQQRRDRNRPDNQRQPQQRRPDQKRDGEEPQDGKQESKDTQQKRGDRIPRGKRGEKSDLRAEYGSWGFLPPEMRQALIENNFRDYFPNYEREIKNYLKSLNKRRRR